MATIGFYAGEDFDIQSLSGSALGFYGDGFGTSVSVGSYQSRMFITNSNGTAQGPETDNVKWAHAASAILGQTGSPILLTQIPNYQATLNIRFTHDTSCSTTNAKARIFDRTSIDSGASGVTTKMAEVIHPDSGQTNTGSGDTTWLTPVGSSVVVDFTPSPGTSGLSPSGSSTMDTQHDFFAAISASPDSIGSKTLFGLYFSLEYL